MYTSRMKSASMDRLFAALLTLKTEEEYYRFFEDLCTVAELQAMAQRLHVAEMLKQNITYTSIAEETGASTATVSRVKKALNYGADGYKLVLERLNNIEG